MGQYNATHLQNQKASTLSIIGGRWTPMGPFGFDSPFADNGGTGRVNVIRFHPSDTTKIFVGTPEGGLWKSENSGATWIPLTDNLPSLGVSDIAIDPKDPLKIYLATGDAKDAGMYGNPYSYGIMKTTNGGQTWSKTGLSWDISERMNIPCVVVSPTDSKIVLAGVFGGSQRGIQKSIDGGTTWEQKDGGSIYHIVYNPADPALIYASGYGNFRRSTDGGDTWTTVTSILPTYVGNNVSRTLIGVTPADPNVVYVLYISHAKNQIYGLYRSTDRGLNFTQVLDTSKNLPFGNSGEYNLVLAVSPIDANTVVIGEQFLAKSTDGGKTWASIGSGVHVDNHAFVFTPHAGLYYSGNDGGIFRSSNGGKGWTDISAGLQITQFYRLGGAVRQDLLYAGAQDNGVQKSDGGIWDHILPGADGGECLVDYSDENIVYMEWQNGDLFRSDDAGASTSYIAPSMKGYWITPYLIHPTNPETIYAAYQDIYKSTNRGDTWKSIGHLVAGNDEFKSLALAPSNDNVIYAGTYIKLFKTTNGGSSWQDITAGSPTGDTAALTYIAVSPTDPQKVWLTFSGFTDHKHVYTSSNGGISWTNITGTLPNVPVNTIIYESGSNDGIYIGTDIGVFYRDKTMTDWEPFITELPNVSVTELEINETSGMIRAATFGRGMWQSPLRNLVPPTAPRLIAPANTATAVPQQPTFIWGRVMRTSKYHFELAKDSLFTSIVMDRDSMSDTTFAYPISLEPGTKYFWRTGGANAAGESLWSETWSFRTEGTSGVENADRQTRISAYPNPFSTTTTFSFMTDNESPVVLDIADLLGRTIENRTYGELGKGFHEIQFDGRSLTAGSYIYSIRVGGKSVIGILRVLR
ncbi:MAG: T9SS type A sorting domain-containing protein [Bacteroidota bacterium]|nr:T9SS type A sorting domain-containing protein [Bacteroidota bacterium]